MKKMIALCSLVTIWFLTSHIYSNSLEGERNVASQKDKILSKEFEPCADSLDCQYGYFYL